MARRSARISSRQSSTPQPVKRVSLSHDAFPIAPRTVPAKLASLQETDEMPGSYPESPTSSILAQPNKRQRITSGTPERANIVPSREEMHPQATHPSTAKADEEARWLGFSAMPKPNEPVAASTLYPSISTPTRSAQKVDIAAQSPTFKFTFQREQSLELSPAAKSLMQEKRAEAAKLKEQMKSTQVTENLTDAVARKIATPKSQRGRFSDAHNAQFDKMASISNHASAYRTNSTRKAAQFTSAHFIGTKIPQSPSKSNLPTSISTPSKTPASNLKRKADVQLTRLSSERQQETASNDAASARKRVKVTTPSQISTHRSAPIKASADITTPSKSPAVSRSAIATKIPEPSATTTPDRSASFRASIKTNETPLLKRTPARAPLSSLLKQAARSSAQKAAQPGLLDRSAIRPIARSTVQTQIVPPTSTTPMRPTTDGQNPFKTETPLQARHTLGAANLLGRFEQLRSTPVKSILRTPQRLYSDDPAKVAAGTHLATPPQIAGRRIPATAPVRKHVDFSSSTKAREVVKQASMSPFTFVAAATSKKVETPKPSTITYPSLDSTPKVDEPLSVQKRRQSSGPRDFTFRAGGDIVFAASTTPTKVGTPRAASAYTIRHVPAEPELSAAIPSTMNAMKQRKIKFEDALTTSQATLSPTVTLGSKKRKFDFENGMAEMEADKENVASAENEDDIDQRPVKRMKQSTASPRMLTTAGVRSKPVAAEIKKRTTLGVKPKAAVGKPPEKTIKRVGTTISMARLNALAQPKKR